MDEQAARRWSCNLSLHHAWLLFSSLSSQTTHFLLTQWGLSPIQTGPVTDYKIVDTCDTNWIQKTAWIIAAGHGLPQHLSGGNNVVQARTFLLKYTRTQLFSQLLCLIRWQTKEVQVLKRKDSLLFHRVVRTWELLATYTWALAFTPSCYYMLLHPWYISHLSDYTLLMQSSLSLAFTPCCIIFVFVQHVHRHLPCSDHMEEVVACLEFFFFYLKDLFIYQEQNCTRHWKVWCWASISEPTHFLNHERYCFMQSQLMFPWTHTHTHTNTGLRTGDVWSTWGQNNSIHQTYYHCQ